MRVNNFRERSNKGRSGIRLLVLTCIATLSLITLSLQTDLFKASAQRKTRTSQTTSRPAKPAASPTAIDSLGAPPPIPRLREKPQAKQQEQDVAPGDVISVMTTEVMLPVTVRDYTGRLVKDLTRKDFNVFEDEQQQPLSDLALRQVPVDAILMVDASSSVASNLDDFRRAAEGFAERLNAEDRVSLLKFDDRIELLQDWTKSRFQLRRALTRIEPGMFTRFFDALLLSSRELFKNNSSRHAVIVLTDGIDSGRGSSLETALQALIKAQVTVYVVSNSQISRAAKKAELDTLVSGTDATVKFNQLHIEDLREGLRVLDLSEQRMEQLTNATGGRLFKPQSFEALDSTYAEVADELRSQYAIYYTPTNRNRDGSFRRVRVQTNNSNYQTRTRVGYFAPKG
jgi:Ca-activated chloride channel homolog